MEATSSDVGESPSATAPSSGSPSVALGIAHNDYLAH